MHFHKPGSETLYKSVPKDILPNEYGGKAGEVKDIKADMKKKLDLYRWVWATSQTVQNHI